MMVNTLNSNATGVTSLAIGYGWPGLSFAAPAPVFNADQLWQYQTGWCHSHIRPPRWDLSCPITVHLRRVPQDTLPWREEPCTLRNLAAANQWETALGCLQQDVPSLAHSLTAKRREDVINGEGMSKSTGLERHTYEATTLDLELATSSVMGAVTSWNPHPLPCCHRDELTYRRGAVTRLFPRLVAEDDKEEAGRARGRTQPG